MSSICWPVSNVKEKGKFDPRRAIFSCIAIIAIWMVNLLVAFFGMPFIIVGKLRYRSPKPAH